MTSIIPEINKIGRVKKTNNGTIAIAFPFKNNVKHMMRMGLFQLNKLSYTPSRKHLLVLF